jgi:pyruvate ferredoxin oxidoreductase gamma subunit
MIEINIHGRGGQGAVTSAELIAISAIGEGKFAQAFPSFGPERRGAPVVAFCRISDKKINIRSKIQSPDVVMVLDPGLLSLENPTEGMNPNGIVIVNTKKSINEIAISIGSNHKIATIDADTIAFEEMGRVIVNTTMIGAFIKATRSIDFSMVKPAILSRFGEKLGLKNMNALKRAYDEVIIKE